MPILRSPASAVVRNRLVLPGLDAVLEGRASGRVSGLLAPPPVCRRPGRRSVTITRVPSLLSVLAPLRVTVVATRKRVRGSSDGDDQGNYRDQPQHGLSIGRLSELRNRTCPARVPLK